MAANNSTQTNGSLNEHLLIPKWINAEYFQPILEKDLPNFAHIKKFTPIAATAPGENYTSIMVRVHIDVELKDGTEQDISYILKTQLESGEAMSLVDDICLFPKEKQMYEVIVPNFMKLYKDAGWDIQFAPKCVNVDTDTDHIVIVLEDLKRKNFKNIDRLKGFDMPHMRRVLRKLAELHAASAVNYELNGPYDEIFDITFYSEKNRKIFEGISKVRQAQYNKAMLTWDLEDVDQYIANMWDPKDLFDQILELVKPDPNEFNVLNHGDCWANNIMFNYKDNGDIDETIFVDLQVGKWGSPAFDLWYLITSSASLDIKIKEFDHFIYIYHQRLVECLKLLNYKKPIPTLKEIHILLMKYGLWGPLTAIGVTVAVLYPSDKDANMDNMLKMGPEYDAFRYKLFSNPYYARAMCQLYPFFRNKGLL